MLRWYDYLFKQAKNGMESEKPVRVFTMGRNEWRNFDDWPPPGAQAQRMYLHSGGKANSSGGDGSLNSTTPKAEPADHYVYDPANPVQTRGGGLCCDNGQLAAGPKEQSDIEKRNDVLVFTSEPLAADLDATGPVSVELFVQSSAVDTDFTAKLVDVASEWIRAEYYGWNSADALPEFNGEGGEYFGWASLQNHRWILWATSNVFLAGHRIRVDISSSNYPRFDRNLNTGETDVAHATKKNAATNTLLHDAAHPSALSISVLPAGN